MIQDTQDHANAEAAVRTLWQAELDTKIAAPFSLVWRIGVTLAVAFFRSG